MTVLLTTRLNRTHLPEAEATRLYLLVQVSAEQQERGERPPLNLAAVMDRSGSMAGAKLSYTRQALKFLVDQTNGGDRLGIVTFDNQVEVLCPGGPLVNKDLVKARVGALGPGGSTNLSGGMIQGYREVRGGLDPSRINRVILMTDGQANMGVTSHRALVEKVSDLRAQGMQLSAIGVGADFEEDLLTAMAEAGGGNFHFIENPDTIPAIFAKELQGLMGTVAQGLELRFAAAPGVTVAGVVGYPPHVGVGPLVLPLPDLYAAEVKSLVLALDLEASFAGAKELGALEFTFVETGNGQEQTAVHKVMANVTGDSALLGAPEDTDVMKQVQLARSVEALEQAVSQADRQDFHSSSVTLAQMAEELEAVSEQTGDGELRARAQQLREHVAEMTLDRYDSVQRKRLKAEAFSQRRGR